MPAIFEPLECPATDAASVPRRFGAGVLLILTTAFAVLFALMRSANVRPALFVIIALLFLAVTLGQILLFKGRKPRQVSLLVGGILLPLALLVVEPYVAAGIFWSGHDLLRLLGLRVGLPLSFLSVASGVLIVSLGVGISALVGYMAGCVVAGIFFVQERFRRRSHPPVKIDLLPFTTADFEILISWVRHAQFFDLWSRGRFHYPLDHEQLIGD